LGIVWDTAIGPTICWTLADLAEKILNSRNALEGERKQATVLFADVKGSMDLAEQLDPDEWHKIIERWTSANIAYDPQSIS
jgi:class 3 adenylate cyclase